MTAQIIDLDRNWESLLIRGREGPKPIIANILTALRKSPEWQRLLQYDEFSRKTLICGQSPFDDEIFDDEEWTDNHDTRCAEWMQNHGIIVSPDQIGRAVDLVAREQTFHPVGDYLNTLVWDGKTQCGNWLEYYLGVERNEYTAAVAVCFMVSAVARIYQPGCKADCAMILEGPQGLRKSSALKALAGPWFTDEISDFGSKDAAMQLAGAWFVELAELDSMNRSEVGRTKAFMSRAVDRYRPPWGKRVIEQPRQCIFAGTVNHGEYLRDETGARRFWPIKCGAKIDLDGLRAARDQLWAHAVHLYKEGAKWWLPDFVSDAAKEQQDDRYQHDEWESAVHQFLLGRNQTSITSILSDCFQISAKDHDQILQNRAARILRVMNWEKHRVREGSKRLWVYIRPIGMPAAGPTLFDALAEFPEERTDLSYRADFE